MFAEGLALKSRARGQSPEERVLAWAARGRLRTCLYEDRSPVHHHRARARRRATERGREDRRHRRRSPELAGDVRQTPKACRRPTAGGPQNPKDARAGAGSGRRFAAADHINRCWTYVSWTTARWCATKRNVAFRSHLRDAQGQRRCNSHFRTGQRELTAAL